MEWGRKDPPPKKWGSFEKEEGRTLSMLVHNMCVLQWGGEKSVGKTIYAVDHEKSQEQYLHLNKSSKETMKGINLS